MKYFKNTVSLSLDLLQICTLLSGPQIIQKTAENLTPKNCSYSWMQIMIEYIKDENKET